jgi:sirohydrochlorin cobaltochelatase
VTYDPERFLKSALVLVGHGSTRNPDSRRSVEEHGAELRRRGGFGQVLECFYKEPPFVGEVWERTRAAEIYVIPVFMSEGYFTQEVIPRELGLPADDPAGLTRELRRGRRVLRYGRPVGTHPSMTSVVEARAEGVLRSFPGVPAARLDQTALVVAGHGTLKHDRSRAVIDDQVEVLRRRGRFAEVHAAFMEEPLRIADCCEVVRALDLVVVPYFVSDGMHVLEDIPVLLGASEAAVRRRLAAGEPVWPNPTRRRGKRVWYTASVGREPLLAEVILERVFELAGAVPLESRGRG